MIYRQASQEIKNLTRSFRVTVVSGPRQSGKTTLLKSEFGDYKYYNLEDLSTLDIIRADPMGFVRSNSRVVVDEVQRLPELLSAIQVAVDERQLLGDYILSGSQNLLISERISQSLAGRAAYQTLLPLSIKELADSGDLRRDFASQMWSGFYPAVYSTGVNPTTYYTQYVATYVERDVRAIKNVQDLGLFRKFMMLLAGRIGQLVNYESLANDTGVSTNTVEQWLSVLEASYIIYRLKPYHANINKRLTKSSKIYFIDTGLACYLLGIGEPREVKTHYLLGGLFENMCIMDIRKQLINTSGIQAELYFYRDSNDKEVDLVVSVGASRLIPIEIKASGRPASSFIDGIESFKTALEVKKDIEVSSGYVIYTGHEEVTIRDIRYLNWASFDTKFF